MMMRGGCHFKTISLQDYETKASNYKEDDTVNASSKVNNEKTAVTDIL